LPVVIIESVSLSWIRGFEIEFSVITYL
jgi:hypothetical protein